MEYKRHISSIAETEYLWVYKLIFSSLQYLLKINHSLVKHIH